jgi:hypothetical protein
MENEATIKWVPQIKVFNAYVPEMLEEAVNAWLCENTGRPGICLQKIHYASTGDDLARFTVLVEYLRRKEEAPV